MHESSKRRRQRHGATAALCIRRHPVALASMARHYADGAVEGAREAYRTARRELAEAVPPHAVDELLAIYRQQGFRLAETATGIALVERALRGEDFPPRF